MKIFFLVLMLIIFCSCQTDKVQVNVAALSDENPETMYIGTKEVNKILFTGDFTLPVQSYSITSSSEDALCDPSDWVLKGSFDGVNWIVLDEQENQAFPSRFLEMTYSIRIPSNYKQYTLEVASVSRDTLKMGEINFSKTNHLSLWDGFCYPDVHFGMEDSLSAGAQLFRKLVQQPEDYIKYHAKKVAGILYYSAQDSMPEVKTINYILKKEIVGKSLYDISHEIRSILYHELAYAYQFKPKGASNEESQAYIQGLANAVRAEAGYFEMQALRKPGGHWLDGYETTGFFLQWLTTKHPDAVRMFHQTVRDLDIWSFDKAVKKLFGEESSIEALWNEYQYFLVQHTK